MQAIRERNRTLQVDIKIMAAQSHKEIKCTYHCSMSLQYFAFAQIFVMDLILMLCDIILSL